MAQVQPITSNTGFDAVQIAEELGRRFAAADVHDEDRFVAENFNALKEAGSCRCRRAARTRWRRCVL